MLMFASSAAGARGLVATASTGETALMCRYRKLSMAAFATVTVGVASAAVATAFDTFVSEAIGLESLSAGAELTKQANSVLGSVSSIQPFRSADTLRGYKSIVNSNNIIITFPLLPGDREKLLRSIDELLAKSHSVTIAPVDQAQSILYTGVSIRKYDDGAAMIEVLVAVADLPSVKAKIEGRTPRIEALAKSTIWMSVTRRRVAWEAISTEGALSFDRLETNTRDMYRVSMENLLLSFRGAR